MRIVKRTLLRIFFGIELVVFMGVYVLSSQGIRALWQLDQENKELIVVVTGLKDEVDHLDQQIVAWNSHDFYKEKVAREQLQMARANDEIYFIMKN